MRTHGIVIYIQQPYSTLVLCHLLPAHNPYITLLDLQIVTMHIQIHDSH